MNTMQRNFLLLFALSVLVYGCRNKETQSLPVDPFAAELFCSFKEGSFWVYQNSSGNIDSSYLSQLEDSKNINTNTQYISCYIRSNLPYNNVQIYSTRNSGASTTVTILYNYPYGTTFQLSFAGEKFDSTITPHAEVSLWNNYQVNQFTFPTAIKIANNTEEYLVVVPNVGIVEKKMDARGVFKLFNYEIKR